MKGKLKLFMCAIAFIGAQGAGAKVTAEVPAMPAADYLEVLAADCGDASWQKVDRWSKQTNFGAETMPALKITVAGNELTSTEIPNAKISVKADKIELAYNSKSYAGRTCDVFAELISGSASARKSALLSQLIPDANAQETKQRSVSEELKRLYAFTIGGTWAGCLGQLQLLDGKTVCLDDAAWNQFGGLVYWGSDAVLNRLHNVPLARAQEIKAMITSGTPSVQCSRNDIYLTNGRKKITAVRNPARVTVYEDGKKIYSGSEEMSRAFVHVFRSCNSSKDAERINLNLASQAHTRKKRLAALKATLSHSKDGGTATSNQAK